MGAGQNQCRTGLLGNVVGEVHGLHVEGEGAGVYDGIGMPYLPAVLLRADHVQCRVVIYRFLSEQTLEDSFNLGQLKDFVNGVRLMPTAFSSRLVRVNLRVKLLRNKSVQEQV